jgi:hypothetical protein
LNRYERLLKKEKHVKSQAILELYKNSTFKIEPLYGIKNKFMPHLNYEIMLNELNELLKLFPKKSEILIINGNQGFIALTLAKLGHRVTILEPYNFELIQNLRIHWKLEEFIEIIKWNESEIQLNFEKNFDLVICADTYLYLNQNFGKDKANEFIDKIQDQHNYILFIELGRDSGKWWLPFVNDQKVTARFTKRYSNILVNNRIALLKMLLVSKTNPKELKIFDSEPMNLIKKNYPNDGRNDHIEIYESSTKIYKKLKKQENFIKSAELEKSNVYKIKPRIRKELELPEFQEWLNEEGEIFISREKYTGKTIHNQKEFYPNSVEMFLNLMLRYSKNGYFHNDLRPWNVIITANQVKLIDFENLVPKDQDPSGFPQWIPMLAVCNYLSQESKREWKLETFLEVSARLIDFRHPLSQIYYEESWHLLHNNKSKILKLDFLNAEKAIKGFLEILNPNFTQIQRYWNVGKYGVQ